MNAPGVSSFLLIFVCNMCMHDAGSGPLSGISSVGWVVPVYRMFHAFKRSRNMFAINSAYEDDEDDFVLDVGPQSRRRKFKASHSSPSRPHTACA